MDLKAQETIMGRCFIIYPDGSHGHCTSVSLNSKGKAISAFSNSCDGIDFKPAIIQAKMRGYSQERIDHVWQERWDEVSYFEVNGKRVDKEV